MQRTGQIFSSDNPWGRGNRIAAGVCFLSGSAAALALVAGRSPTFSRYATVLKWRVAPSCIVAAASTALARVAQLTFGSAVKITFIVEGHFCRWYCTGGMNAGPPSEMDEGGGFVTRE